MNPWVLPTGAQLGIGYYTFNTDYRDILEIISYLDDPQMPLFIRWQIAVTLFCKEPVENCDMEAVARYLCRFINGGYAPVGGPATRLMDWKQDAPMVLSEVNRVSGKEVRQEDYIHWWTFLGWFHAIGEGPFSTVIAIRDKLRRGQKLESWEREFYKRNKETVDLRPRYTPEERAEHDRLIAFLTTP